MRRPGKARKTGGRKPLGEQGRRVRNQIISGHKMEIKRLQAELKKTRNPIQKRLLTEQIGLERASLARFRRQTK